MARSATANGKIILSGEYAVVFGHRGIAFPAKDHALTVSFEETPGATSLKLHSVAVQTAHPEWDLYVRRIVSLCEAQSGEMFVGTLKITGNLPVGKGMGSSTALVVAGCRCLLGDDIDEAFCKSVEDVVNPGNSGLDFAVIWNNVPVIFKKGAKTEACPLPADLLKNATLIDTGAPNETTAQLVSWIKEQHAANDERVVGAIKTIGKCTERILQGEDLKAVLRDHHRAQVALGVVPEAAQALIQEIEAKGGTAKVLGAGARSGGGGMVLQIP
jgi:mevalonate kinase